MKDLIKKDKTNECFVKIDKQTSLEFIRAFDMK